MKLKLLSISLIFTLLLGSGMTCSDDEPQPEPQLPDITQEGKGTLGFLKNDSLWLPSSPKSVWPKLLAQYDQLDSTMNITASIYNSKGELVEALYLTFGPMGTGQNEFKLAENYKNRGYFEYGYDPDYATNKVYNGKVNLLKFDLSNYIVAGTFNFKAIHMTTGDTIEIKNGRFDLMY